MKARTWVVGMLVLPAMACGLEKLDDEGGGDGGVPPAVQQIFSDGCAISGCHDGSVAPNLSPGNSDAIIGQNSSSGQPMVEFGNLNSEIAVRLLLEEGEQGRMPLGTRPFSDADRATVIGWIAGSPFDDTDGGSTTDDSTTTVASTTTDTTTTTTTSTTTMGGSSGGMDTGAEPTLANVQSMVFDAYCTTAGACHDGTIPPNLTPGMTVASTVGVMSMQAADVPYIDPSNSAGSYLLAKCDGTAGTLGGVDSIMPVGGMLTSGEIALLSAWIDAGAMP